MIHCLHGNVSSQRSWDVFRDRLVEPINPIDLWTLAEKELTLTQAGIQIAQEAQQGDLLLGYSLGGRLALHALIANPDIWKAAIIVSAHPGLQTQKKARLESDLNWSALAERNWSEFLAQWNSLEILNNNPSTIEGFIQASKSDQKQISLAFRHWSLGRQMDLRPLLPKIKCPILWLTGEDDSTYCQLAREAVSQLSRATHHTIKKAGHRAPWQQPQSFLNKVDDFLSTLPD